MTTKRYQQSLAITITLFGTCAIADDVTARRDAEASSLIDSIHAKQNDDWIGIAFYQLRGMGADAIPALERALASPDHDRRQHACTLLMDLASFANSKNEQLVRVSDDLMRTAIESLKDDNIPRRVKRPSPKLGGEYFYEVTTPARNAIAAIDFLARNIDRAEPLLVEALRSQDGQQRFLAACVLACTRRESHAQAICEVLLPQLKSNDIAGDADCVGIAIRALGVPALIYVEAELARTKDVQAAQHLAELLGDLRRQVFANNRSEYDTDTPWIYLPIMWERLSETEVAPKRQAQSAPLTPSPPR